MESVLSIGGGGGGGIVGQILLLNRGDWIAKQCRVFRPNNMRWAQKTEHSVSFDTKVGTKTGQSVSFDTVFGHKKQGTVFLLILHRWAQKQGTVFVSIKKFGSKNSTQCFSFSNKGMN